MIIICDKCFEVVAHVDLDKFFYPPTGSMFKSPDPHHGLPDPFPYGADWSEMFCPYSNRTHRISAGPDAVMNDKKAYYRIPTYEEVIARRNVQAEINKEPEAPAEAGKEQEDDGANDPGTVNEVKEITEEKKIELVQEAAAELKEQPVIKTPYDDPTGQEKNAISEAPKPEKQQVVDDGTMCRVCGHTFKTKAACSAHRAIVHKPGSERELE